MNVTALVRDGGEAVCEIENTVVADAMLRDVVIEAVLRVGDATMDAVGEPVGERVSVELRDLTGLAVTDSVSASDAVAEGL